MTNRPSEIVTKNKVFLDLQVDPKDDNGNLFYTVFTSCLTLSTSKFFSATVIEHFF